MNKRLIRNAFSVTAISIIALGMASWLAGCSDNVVDPETIPPSQPTNVIGTRLDSTIIDLTWTASTDNVCVAGYNVYRGDSEESILAGVTPINSFRDTALVSDVTYSYSVEAFDCSNNISPRSPFSAPIVPPELNPGDSTILNSTIGFACLAGTTITNTGATVVSGNVGLSPGSSVTGFPPGQVMPLDDIHINDELANQAKVDLTSAYLYFAGHAPGASVAGNIGGQTLAPGTYTSSSTLEISSGDLTLDAGGNNNAIFIFQIASALTVTTDRQVILAGGAQAKNIYWQVGSAASLGTGSAFKGNILALDAITMQTGARLDGRAFARNGALTLDNNIISKP